MSQQRVVLVTAASCAAEVRSIGRREEVLTERCASSLSGRCPGYRGCRSGPGGPVSTRLFERGSPIMVYIPYHSGSSSSEQAASADRLAAPEALVALALPQVDVFRVFFHTVDLRPNHRVSIRNAGER
jgi:hypothetical protein